MVNEIKWRVIVRFSLNGDSAPLRNRLSKLFQDYGISKHSEKTATWESDQMPPADCSDCLCEILSIIAADTANTSLNVQLDHLWVYIDTAQV